MGALARAVEAERWEVVALCLLVGALRALRRLPPGEVEDLLAVLEGEDAPPAEG